MPRFLYISGVLGTSRGVESTSNFSKDIISMLFTIILVIGTFNIALLYCAILIL